MVQRQRECQAGWFDVLCLVFNILCRVPCVVCLVQPKTRLVSCVQRLVGSREGVTERVGGVDQEREGA
jgi:hypothetical protein